MWCQHEPLLSTSTYLVAYAVHNLASLPVLHSETHNNVSFRSWMPPDAIKDGTFTANFAPRALSYLEKLLEFAFPLRKVDQLALPTHKFSAMENWGLVTFKQTRFVHYDDEQMQDKEDKTFTVAHEYGHQWFGNLVAINWWNDLWLKEGPSTYFGYLAMDALMPEWGSLQRRVADDLASFFCKDMFNDTIAISRDVQDSKSILDQFTPHVYQKGSLTMRMLHKLLGDDSFFMGIRNYLRRHAYDSVRQSDLWQAMQEAADLNGSAAVADVHLSTVMDSWTLQKGYPLLTVIRNYSSSTVWIDQARFMLTADAGQPTCWWIPLTFVNQRQANFDETQPQFWLECPSTGKTLRLRKDPAPNEWIMLNPQVTSIYRVNYDEPNWRLIIKTLNSPDYASIHALNRAQLLDDLLMLAATRTQSYDLAFAMLEYLPHEAELLPWSRAVALLNDRGQLLRGEQERIFRVSHASGDNVGKAKILIDANSLQLFMKKLMTALFRRTPQLKSAQLGVKSGSLTALYRLAYKEACRYNVADCISQVERLSKDNGNGSQVPADYRAIADCTSIELGNTALFQSILKRFRDTDSDAKKSAWATALGCSRDFGQLQPFLDHLIESTDKLTYSYYMQAVTTALERKHLATQIADHIMQHAKAIK